MARTKGRRRRSQPLYASPIDAEIDKLRARAARVGVHLMGDVQRLTSTLPVARCTPEERARAEALAAAQGITLSEHIRRRAISDLTLVVE